MAEKLDFKKKHKDLYLPKQDPALIEVPPIRYFMVDGEGAPESRGYQNAVQVLYALSYGIKMSNRSPNPPEGYFEYSVAPLEGLWDSAGGGYDPNRDHWVWTAMIRQPDFVREEVFRQAVMQVAKKKPELDFGAVRLAVYEEGLCVQLMHNGPYSTEPVSLAKMEQFIAANGLVDDCGPERRHHEVYMSDPRKTAPEKMKTVLRHPVKRA
ncbi:hypothetical protein D3C74_164900 [compost metagenome]